MTRSETITHLAAALAKAQAEMPVAVFDATNPFLKSKYASLGAVIQSSRPILAKHGLSLVQFPTTLIRPPGTFSRSRERRSGSRGRSPHRLHWRGIHSHS